jgi:hypothetical protein
VVTGVRVRRLENDRSLKSQELGAPKCSIVRISGKDAFYSL